MAYLFLAGWLLLLAFWIWAIVDCGRTDEARYGGLGISKGLTMLLIFLTGWFGAAYWFARMRRRVR